MVLLQYHISSKTSTVPFTFFDSFGLTFLHNSISTNDEITTVVDSYFAHLEENKEQSVDELHCSQRRHSSRQLFLAFFEINLDIFRYVCLILCNLRQRFAAFKNTISTPEEILNVGKNRYNFFPTTQRLDR